MRARLLLLVGFVVLFSLSFQSQRSISLDSVASENAKFFDNFHLPAAASLSGKSCWWLYIALAATASANMVLHDPALLTALGYSLDK